MSCETNYGKLIVIPDLFKQQPAASVPCGFTTNGLPVVIQIVAAKYRDLLVLQAAKAYESISPFIMPLELNRNVLK
ncbi:MAG: hypothetical protein V7L11_00945 [Nostoc sp.]|uniref:hypothetical protein n=1 Tax=Nostoc sp. TaxID=1180 RepID=UPI002FFA46DF